MGLFGKSWDYSAIPDLKGKVVLVTGGSAGLGKITCLELARKNATVYVMGRTKEKTQGAIDEIIKETGNQNVHFIMGDLMDLKSVSDAADEFLSKNVPLHVLVNNAGIMAVPWRLSKDGIESQFATNHFAHFLLTRKLLPLLEKSAPSRVVNLSSLAHKFSVSGGIDFEKLNDEKSYFAWTRYGETKLANILFTRELARQLAERGVDNVFVNCCHPGSVKTELTRESQFLNSITKKILGVFQLSSHDGAKTQTFLAADASIESENTKGKYYVPTAKEARPNSYALDDALAKKCWEWTEAILKDKGFN